jgi:hypothetical protein
MKLLKITFFILTLNLAATLPANAQELQERFHDWNLFKTERGEKGKEKEVEVGKFNYKITAIWAATPPKPPKPRVKSFKKSPPSRSK